MSLGASGRPMDLPISFFHILHHSLAFISLFHLYTQFGYFIFNIWLNTPTEPPRLYITTPIRVIKHFITPPKVHFHVKPFSQNRRDLPEIFHLWQINFHIQTSKWKINYPGVSTSPGSFYLFSQVQRDFHSSLYSGKYSMERELYNDILQVWYYKYI